MSEKRYESVSFEYMDRLFQDYIAITQQLYKCCFHFYIPITEFIDFDSKIDEFDVWHEEIYEKCTNRNIPNEYMELDDYYKNPENPKMTKNIEKHEFCLEKENTDDYSCEFDECPRRN
jgi:hypothetical protein